MLSVKDEQILAVVLDYKINLIAPAHIDKEVLFYIKYFKDKEKLEQVVLSDERFHYMERSAAVVIN